MIIKKKVEELSIYIDDNDYIVADKVKEDSKMVAKKIRIRF